MSLRNVTAAFVVLAATTVWAQEAPTAGAMPAAAVNSRRPIPGNRRVISPFGNSKAAGDQNAVTLHQKMLELDGTLRQMHSVAQLMHSKAASSGKESLAKENVAMWDLMLSHLDKQFEELKAAAAARDELEIRRAALYKQADEKAAAEAAKGATASQPATPGAPAQVPPAQPAAGQTAPAPASSPSNSPN